MMKDKGVRNGSDNDIILYLCVLPIQLQFIQDITWRSWFELPRPSVYGYCIVHFLLPL